MTEAAVFTAKDVQRLRQATGSGMMDAKRALTESKGDYDAAAQWLREQGLASSAKRADRENEEGAVAAVVTEAGGAVVELRCETDFVAKSPPFVALAGELAASVAESGESAVPRVQSRLDDLKVSLKENIEVGRIVRFEKRDGAVLDTYLHVQSERGKSGVLVELEGGDRSLAHDVAMHIAAMRPIYLSRDDVPTDVVVTERKTLEALTRNEGKPTQAIEKIVEGRLNGFFKEVCLLEQGFVRDDKRTVEQVVGAAKVARFAHVEIGRG